jgi:hypothetical protein
VSHAGSSESAARTEPWQPWRLAALSVAQVVSWGILFYAMIVAAPVVADDTGWPLPLVTTLFSVGLVVSALVGMPVGRWLDAHGPRDIMTAGSVVGVAGLLVVSVAPSPWIFGLGWVIAGPGTERVGERVRAIAGPVVGHHGRDGDAVLGEERPGAGPERCGGLLAFIVELLGVGKAGGIVDRVMQERVPQSLLLVVAIPGLPAEHAPAAAVRDPAELLDVHMDQLARDLLLVADRRGLADREPGGLVEMM